MGNISERGAEMRASLLEAARGGNVLPFGFCTQLAASMGFERSTVTKAATALGLSVADPKPKFVEPIAVTRRCMNKNCIERFVPVSINNWYHSPDCDKSEDRWTVDEILHEEGALRAGSSHMEMAKAAFGQKNQAVRENTRLRSLRDYLRSELTSFYDENPDARYPVVKYRESATKSKNPREILVQLSDWQIGKWEQGFGVEATLERVEGLKRATRAVVDRTRAAGHPVDRAVITWGGDMIEGCFIYGGQNITGLDKTANTHRITQQVRLVAHQMAEFAADVATYVKQVDNVSVGGNHGRPNGRNDFADSEDNFDTMAAWWAQDLNSKTDRIKWNISEDWWAPVEISGHYGISFHGDQWRGPLSQLDSLLPQWITSGEFGQMPEFVLTHHRHTLSETDVSGIPVLQNGTIDGGSRYYMKAYGKVSRAAQRIAVFSESYVPEACWPVRFDRKGK